MFQQFGGSSAKAGGEVPAFAEPPPSSNHLWGAGRPSNLCGGFEATFFHRGRASGPLLQPFARPGLLLQPLLQPSQASVFQQFTCSNLWGAGRPPTFAGASLPTSPPAFAEPPPSSSHLGPGFRPLPPTFGGRAARPTIAGASPLTSPPAFAEPPPSSNNSGAGFLQSLKAGRPTFAGASPPTSPPAFAELPAARPTLR